MLIMANEESWLENLSIYNDNLSVYYIGSIVISLVSVLLTWWYHRYEKNRRQSLISNSQLSREEDFADNFGEEEQNITFSEEKTNLNESNIHTWSQIKAARQSAIVEQLTASLTDEQLQEERKIEAQQLEAIFQLLQNQEDKFHVGSMQELQDQLKLYRH